MIISVTTKKRFVLLLFIKAIKMCYYVPNYNVYSNSPTYPQYKYSAGSCCRSFPVQFWKWLFLSTKDIPILKGKEEAKCGSSHCEANTLVLDAWSCIKDKSCRSREVAKNSGSSKNGMFKLLPSNQNVIIKKKKH